jgi:hypothetical protein
MALWKSTRNKHTSPIAVAIPAPRYGFIPATWDFFDAILAPSRDQLLRVLAPQGVAYLKQGGVWKKTVKLRPKEMDEWTHFDYGPEGNGVSHDKLVRQPNFGDFAFSPQETDAELQTRLSTAPPKKK